MRGDAGKNAKEGTSCVVCGIAMPPALGFKPRKYCSRRCTKVAYGFLPKPQSVTCRSCGKPVVQSGKGRTRWHCSSACRREANHRKKVHKRHCKTCGGEFVRFKQSKYCSEPCRYKNRLVVKPCEKCGVDFKQRHSTSRFCSNSCSASALYRVRFPPKPCSRQCLCCQKPFVKKTGRNSGKYCSRSCAFEARRLRLPHAMYNNRKSASIAVQLSIWFNSWGNDSHDPLFSGQNRGGHKFRCLKYGCHYESFPSKRILLRDGWRCQICGCELLPKWTTRNGSSPHPKSPTIDHIIPLSFGPDGPGHTPSNLQAACWECNLRKSDSVALP